MGSLASCVTDLQKGEACWRSDPSDLPVPDRESGPAPVVVASTSSKPWVRKGT